jgi:hypothetical protein
MPVRRFLRDDGGKVLDLTWYERPDLESCKRLWRAVLVQNIWEALWREHRTTNLKGEVKYWGYDKRSRTWVMNDSKDLNSFIGLCDLCEVNHLLLRRKILQTPDGWYPGEKEVENVSVQ